MKLAALVRTFLMDHFRTSAVLTEASFISIMLFIFLDPSKKPYAWSQVVVAVMIIGILITALSTSLLVWCNADRKIEVIVIKAGRIRYFFSILIAALLISLLWLLIIAGYVYFLLSLRISIPQLLEFITALAFVKVTVSALFLLFSLLNGKGYELCIAIILVLLGFNTSYFIELGEPWHLVASFLPPLQENIYSLTQSVPLPLTKSAIYASAVIALGLLRFTRREFIQS